MAIFGAAAFAAARGTGSGDGTGVTPMTGGIASLAPSDSSLPLRAAFYYPWFPEAWTQLNITPYTKYSPTLGYYDSSSPTVIRQQISAMQYGNISAGIASWWGQGTATDARVPTILSATAGTGFKWSLYYEPEGQGLTAVAQIAGDLAYIQTRHASDPSFLHIGGKFVVFVYGDPTDDCTTADRWKQANTFGAYVVLKVFPGYTSCASQPESWHQYAPAIASSAQRTYSYSISPGFDKVGEATRLARDLARWQTNVTAMAASSASFQLVTTFDEWGEGTSVESAAEWASASGYGAYLDALHNSPVGASTTPSPTATRTATATTFPAASSTATPIGTAAATTTPSADVTILAAGDISSCGSPGDSLTATELDALQGTVLTLGDNAYESGTAAEFSACYDPTWGRAKSRTMPAPGNHEYLTAGASGYFGYFGAVAGDPLKGYYSYDVGTWHLIALNSNCTPAGGCSASSPQEQWLRADLAAHPTACTLAYWHHPRFSSGEHGSDTKYQALWQALYDAGADIVLNGHDHDYERFTSQTPAGDPDLLNGIREFVVGTGGASHYAIGTPISQSEVREGQTFGVLRLTLHATSYDWSFLPVAGASFADAGAGSCHASPLSSSDIDGDGAPDATDNCPFDANAGQANNDRNFIDQHPVYAIDDITRPVSDSQGDACDSDDDNDGLSDSAETSGPPCATAIGPTNPLVTDTDRDGITDGAECALGSNPNDAQSNPPTPSAATDPDRDGLSTAFEVSIGSNPNLADTDGDGLVDGWEYNGYRSLPTAVDSDGDAIADGCEVASLNGDTVVNVGDQAILSAEVGRKAPASQKLGNFDINKDGAINVGDQAIVSGFLARGACQ